MTTLFEHNFNQKFSKKRRLIFVRMFFEYFDCMCPTVFYSVDAISRILSTKYSKDPLSPISNVVVVNIELLQPGQYPLKGRFISEYIASQI